jgi:MYXO-CTERM domain-containing protein
MNTTPRRILLRDRTPVLLSLLVAMLVVAAAAPAWTCGVPIVAEGADVSLDAQRVLLYDRGGQVDVVAQIQFESTSDFAWLIPLASVPTEIRAMDGQDQSLMASLDAWTQPYFADDACPDLSGNNGAGGSANADGPDVTLFGSGTAGTFDYVILGGDTGAGVLDYLQSNGFSVPESAGDAVSRYVEAGRVFLALRLTDGVTGTLSPGIAFTYEGAPGFPLGIARASAKDDLEIILYIVGDGSYAPANASSSTISLQDISSADEYTGRVRDLGQSGEWVLEYAGDGGRTWWVGDSLERPDYLPTAMEEYFGKDGLTVTRLHGILPPAQLQDDLAFAPVPNQIESSFLFPATGCPSLDPRAGDTDTIGCAAAPGSVSAPWWLALGLAALVVRRRHR